MDAKDFFDFWNLNITDEQAIAYIDILVKSYSTHKNEETFHNEHNFIPENIIALYLNFVLKRDYKLVVEDYKSKFIVGEAAVEPGITPEEKIGLGKIYDYISTFDYGKKDINVFIEGMRLHSILYSSCPFPEFGGKLRQSPAVLKDANVEVVPPEQARAFFQSFLTKKFTITEDGIFDYINECVRLTVDLIRVQPFSDGNKRTFRAVLNMLLGKIKIPPVFITLEEREIYKKELLKALEKGDYLGITRFYYYKICDSIVDFGIELKPDNLVEEPPKKFIMKPVEEKKDQM